MKKFIIIFLFLPLITFSQNIELRDYIEDRHYRIIGWTTDNMVIYEETFEIYNNARYGDGYRGLIVQDLKTDSVLDYLWFHYQEKDLRKVIDLDEFFGKELKIWNKNTVFLDTLYYDNLDEPSDQYFKLLENTIQDVFLSKYHLFNDISIKSTTLNESKLIQKEGLNIDLKIDSLSDCYYYNLFIGNSKLGYKKITDDKKMCGSVGITYDGYYLSHNEDRILIVISVDVRSGFTDEEIDSGGYEGDTDIYWIEKHFYGCSLNPSTFK